MSRLLLNFWQSPLGSMRGIEEVKKLSRPSHIPFLTMLSTYLFLSDNTTWLSMLYGNLRLNWHMYLSPWIWYLWRGGSGVAINQHDIFEITMQDIISVGYFIDKVIIFIDCNGTIGHDIAGEVLWYYHLAQSFVVVILSSWLIFESRNTEAGVMLKPFARVIHYELEVVVNNE